MSQITFVTAWYNMNSKFNIKTYQKWMSNFLNNVEHFYLVIYTNKDSFHVIEPYMKNINIKIIIKEFNDFYCHRFDWIKNHEKNYLLNEKSYLNTDWKLNMLWNEKIYFLKHVIEKKVFDTEFYGWCDIGYFRLNNDLIKKWPNHKKISMLDKTKIYYAKVNRDNNNFIALCRYASHKNDNGLPVTPIPPNQISFAGGFFILHKSKYEWWNLCFYNTLEKYFKHNYLVKDDQIIILDCIVSNIPHFNIIQEIDNRRDPWFAFQHYLL